PGNHWLWRRGHGATFVLLFIFSVVLYVRPYEAFPFLSGFMQMAFYTGVATIVVFAISQLGIEGNLTARPREINLVLLLGLAALLSMPLAGSIGDAWKTFSEQLIKTLIIFIVLVNVLRTQMRMKLLLLLVLAVSIYLSVNALNDYRLGMFGVGEFGTARIAGRIKGLFENSNDLALHLVTMVPIAVALGLSKAGLFRKLVYFGAAALMIGAIIATFSRGGFLGLIAAGVILARRLGRKNKGATTAAIVFAGIMFLALAPGAYSSRLGSIFNSASDLTGSSSQRTEVFKRSIWVALRYPIFGVGIGNFQHKSPRNLVTHNAYTQVAAEMGIAAMVVYIMFLVHPIRRLRLIENQSHDNPDQRWFYYLSIGLQASLVGFMVSSFFGAVAYQWYVYYLVGYAIGLHRIYIMKTEPESDAAAEKWLRPFAKKKEKEELVGAQADAV
ncbi:MAG TPA: O-antigen ligase family protein, partial [Pyrinomonadaceae bacterium]|nr:O-antigen ligase family protein [Pyrinomonadaceae bacterium]